MISRGGHLVPCVADWNNDGKKDLVIGNYYYPKETGENVKGKGGRFGKKGTFDISSLFKAKKKDTGTGGNLWIYLGK